MAVNCLTAERGTLLMDLDIQKYPPEWIMYTNSRNTCVCCLNENLIKLQKQAHKGNIVPQTHQETSEVSGLFLTAQLTPAIYGPGKTDYFKLC